MAKKGSRILIGLVCDSCSSVNYVISKNKLTVTTPIKLKKYCKKCKKHQIHKETKKLD
ncbi:MAG: 50S ribosomal protein L33 [Patescibacteria group bacterium]|nr:50S ribosomal protein L33 [Patescibacteria group bacterium]